MDKQESCIIVEVVKMAREKGLLVVTLPPHCSHRMQPLDVGRWEKNSRSLHRLGVE